MTSEIPVTDDSIPSTRILETTATTHTTMGTYAEVIQNMITLGWEVKAVLTDSTALQHPLIEGTVRYVYQ